MVGGAYMFILIRTLVQFQGFSSVTKPFALSFPLVLMNDRSTYRHVKMAATTMMHIKMIRKFLMSRAGGTGGISFSIGAVFQDGAWSTTPPICGPIGCPYDCCPYEY
jgi:hypothetical protein